MGTTPPPGTLHPLTRLGGVLPAGSGRQQPEPQTWGVPPSAGRDRPRRQEVRGRGGEWREAVAGSGSPRVRPEVR